MRPRVSRVELVRSWQAERRGAGVRALAHGCGVEPQRRREVRVAATLHEDQLQHGALVGGKRLQAAHCDQA